MPADMLQGWLQSPVGEFVAILVRIAQVPDGIAQIPGVILYTMLLVNASAVNPHGFDTD